MEKVRHRKRQYKQMALEVAVRNPERYQNILETFSKYEGCALNDDVILDIYAQLYIDGAVFSNKFDAENTSPAEIKDFIRENNTHNNEWGFPTGYQAAFTRYLKTLSEFGFIYAQYGETLRLSPVARALVSHRITLSEAFSLQCMRFWRKSPYRRVLNDFNWFKFILEVIGRRNNEGHRLSYPQFLLSLFSDDGDADRFIQIITDNRIGDNEDKAYSLARTLYGVHDNAHQKIAKKNTAFRDYGNTVFRVLQLTGFITVEYDGVMQLSINKEKKPLLDSLSALDFTLPETAKESEMDYFNHLGTFTDKHFDILRSGRKKHTAATDYNMKLRNIVYSYNLDGEKIANMLTNTSEGVSKDIFWFIQAPVKFEFLLTLLLYFHYGDEYEYRPNYLCDEAGIPYSHAPGNMGDIEIRNEQVYWLIEATLIKSKKQQINNETVNLFRHISDSGNTRAKYLSLIAPAIHPDTTLLIHVAAVVSMIEKRAPIYTKTYSTREFIEDVANKKCIGRMVSETADFRNAMIEVLLGK